METPTEDLEKESGDFEASVPQVSEPEQSGEEQTKENAEAGEETEQEIDTKEVSAEEKEELPVEEENDEETEQAREQYIARLQHEGEGLEELYSVGCREQVMQFITEAIEKIEQETDKEKFEGIYQEYMEKKGKILYAFQELKQAADISDILHSDDERILYNTIRNIMLTELLAIQTEEEKAIFLSNASERMLSYIFDEDGNVNSGEAEKLKELDRQASEKRSLAEKVAMYFGSLEADTQEKQKAQEEIENTRREFDTAASRVLSLEELNVIWTEFDVVVQNSAMVFGITEDVYELAKDYYIESNFDKTVEFEANGKKYKIGYGIGETQIGTSLYQFEKSMTTDYLEAAINAMLDEGLNLGKKVSVSVFGTNFASGKMPIPITESNYQRIKQLKDQGQEFIIGTGSETYTNIKHATTLAFTIDPYFNTYHWNMVGGGYSLEWLDADAFMEFGKKYNLCYIGDDNSCKILGTHYIKEQGFPVNMEAEIENPGLYVLLPVTENDAELELETKADKAQIAKIVAGTLSTTNKDVDSVKVNFEGNAPVVLDKTIFEALDKNDAVKDLIVEHAGVKYQFGEITESLDFTVGHAEKAPELYKEYQIAADEPISYVIDFAHSGKLPGTASVTIPVKGVADGSYIWSYINETSKKLEESVVVQVEKESVTVPLKHCSAYALSVYNGTLPPDSGDTEEKPDDGGNGGDNSGNNGSGNNGSGNSGSENNGSGNSNSGSSNNGGSHSSDNNSAQVAVAAQAPKTGDTQRAEIWFALLLLGAAAFGAGIFRYKKMKQADK